MMKRSILAIILASLFLAACAEVEQRPAPNLAFFGENGTHIMCENGRCLRSDGCPDGYDEFQSQVGPACVKHYGKPEMAEWPTCSRSYSNCQCTYIDRDTKGQPVPWETNIERLRCAPGDYRDFLVHGGLTGVDDNGQDYAMIA